MVDLDHTRVLAVSGAVFYHYRQPFYRCYVNTHYAKKDMIVAICQIELSLGGVASLKEKRRIIKSVIGRLSNQFNISVAEVAHQDVWQSAILGVSAVGNDTKFLQRVIEKIIAWIEENRLDVDIADYMVEFV